MSATGLESSAAQPHRREIDGLRAVAVLAILIFHAAPSLAPGGFVGVDVFFVISGFLITRIIAGERDAGQFSFARFYMRRARRILPAYVAVTAVVATIACWIMLPRELAAFGWSLGASGVFLTNFVFAQTLGYFEPIQDLAPLLHLWSLAVEEQFYLLWPLLLAGLSLPFLRRARLWLVLALAALSLAAAQMLVASGDARPAFFLLPYRAWELLLGAAMALGVPAPRSRAAAEAAVVAGLLLIAGSIWGLSPRTPFPGLGALPACLGAALVIWGGGQARLAAPLRAGPVVGLGLISYSLYLWHWPLLAFGRLVLEGPLELAEGLAIASLSVVLAFLTWRFVEQPWRTLMPRPKLRHLAYAVVPLAAILGAGLLALRTGGLPQRLPPAALAAAQLEEKDINPLREQCIEVRDETTTAACRPVGPTQVIVWGDSHADALTPGAASWAERQGFGLQQSTRGGCPPLVGVRAVILPARVNKVCEPFNQSVLRDIAAAPDLKMIVLAARWPLYADAQPAYDINSPRVRVERAGGPRGQAVPLRAALAQTLDAIAATGTKAKVVVIGPTPELTLSPPLCLARSHILGMDEDRCGFAPAKLPMLRSAQAEAEITAVLANRPAVGLAKPSAHLCPDDRCPTRWADGALLYFDDDHLSATAARRLVPGWIDAAIGG